MLKIFFKIKVWIYKLFSKNFFFKTENIVCYIYSNQALPLPLNSEEEAVLIEKSQEGCEHSRGKLIEHNLRLVVYIANKFESTGIDFEDLISIGSVGLIKAVKTFKNDKNIKLATYASRCIENEILMQLRKTSKLKSEISLDKPLSEDGEGNQLVLADILANEEDEISSNIETSAEKDAVWEVLKGLETREQEIMILRFGLEGKEELTQKEVADKLGISQSYISRIEKKILGKMKKQIVKIL